MVDILGYYGKKLHYWGRDNFKILSGEIVDMKKRLEVLSTTHCVKEWEEVNQIEKKLNNMFHMEVGIHSLFLIYLSLHSIVLVLANNLHKN